MDSPGFLDPQKFEYTRLLEDNYSAIKTELLNVLERGAWSRYVDHDERRGRALLFLLYIKGRPNRRNCRLCPKTAEVLAQIPNIRQAVFGLLPPGAVIAPHRGAPGILRVHLGLITEPDASGWKAEGNTENCVEGKVSIFEDGALHEAWNRGHSPRVTLICDPPAPAPERETLRALAGYERRYGLGYLLRTYGKPKPARHPYNRVVLPLLLPLEQVALRVEPWLLPFILFIYNHFSARYTAPPHANS